MNIIVKGKNVEVTPALRAHAEKKVAKLERLFEKKPIEVQVTLSIERGIHACDITVLVNGLLLRGEEKSGDMYASIDGAADKVERQVRKHKTRINKRLKTEGNIIVDSAEETLVPEEDMQGLIRTKKFNVKPMSTEEAIMQMDLLGHDFFVFSNSDTGLVNVVYRRKDAGYGLIEPEI